MGGCGPCRSMRWSGCAPGSAALTPSEFRAALAAVADQVWYPVWDSGMSLDHSVRTPGEACQVAGSDLKAALGLLDGRHVAGDVTLTRAVLEHVRADWRAAAG